MSTTLISPTSQQKKKKHVPLPREMLRNNRNKPLQAAQDRPMYDHRPRMHALLGTPELQVEPLRKLEVELDRRALEGALERVADGDIDFGAVEGSVAGIEVPFAGVLFVEGFSELL